MTAAETPLVSALVSTYAAARLLPGLLTDLTAQTLAGRLEIVVVDAGSPEEEGQIVRAWQRRFPRLVYQRTGRENLYQSLNRCLKLARGKYVTLANTDDRHLPEAFARLVAKLEAEPDAALAYADVAVTANEHDLCGRRLDEIEPLAVYRWPDFAPRSFFACCYAGPQPMWRRALHERYGGFDPGFRLAGDYEFWLRLISQGERFVHVPELLGLMLHSFSSISHSDRQRLELENRLSRERYWPPAAGPLPVQGATGYLQLPPATSGPRCRIAVLCRTGRARDDLATSLASLLRQTEAAGELLLLDQGFFDLGPVLAALPPAWPHRIYDVRRLGPQRARQQALADASCAQLLFLAGGDRWHDTHLREHLQALETAEWAYSEAFYLPHRQTSAQRERWRSLHNNRPELSLAGQFGQFRPSVALSLRRELLRALPAEVPPALARLFAPAAAVFPDWDLQLLALQQARPRRLRRFTCETPALPPRPASTLTAQLEACLAPPST